MSAQESNLKRILGSRITLFLLLLVSIWLLVSLANIFYKKYKVNKEIEDMKAQIADAQKSNQQISEMIDYLGSKNFLEKEAREKLNLKREGEEVVIIEPSKELATNSPEITAQTGTQRNENGAQQREKPKEDPNFVKWWKYFFR